MPKVAVSHHILDLPTLFAVTVFISAIAGLLLVFAWVQNRKTPALAMWGGGLLMGSAAGAMLASAGFAANTWTVAVANALLCGGYGLAWGGARSFEGRRIHIPLMAAGAAIWFTAHQFGVLAQSVPNCMKLVSFICGSYALLCARELWYARDRELLSRWPTLVLATVHAGFMYARIPFAAVLGMTVATAQPPGAIVTVIAFEAMFAAFCLPFLRVAMAKERSELEQRRAALTDSLTGVANRRAFFERGSPLLEQALAAHGPVALLLFDLDRFKEINDTAGHQTGDRVLQAFGHLVAAGIRPTGLFARLGGEEFACLLPATSMTQALHTADRLRHAFEAMRLPNVQANLSVSVGVAMGGETCRTLPALLAAADRALYRAKAEGRNRVAAAPLVLVEGKSGEGVAAAELRGLRLPLPAGERVG